MRQVNADRLVEDLCAVADDVNVLVKATAGNANEAIVGARERIGCSLRAAKDNLENVRRRAVDEAKGVGQSVNGYVRDNVWTLIGIAGSVGLLLGGDSERQARIRAPAVVSAGQSGLVPARWGH